MIEIGAALLILACTIAFLIGCNEQQTTQNTSYSTSTGKRGLSTTPVPRRNEAEADFYAAYTYQETGEPSAFMLFDHEEPVQAPQVVQARTPKPKRQPKRRVVKTQQQRPVKNTQEVHPLHQDCVDTLVAIGYNKTEAKKIVKNLLTASITSIQDFLSIAIRKN
jgi:hypothetical protein